MDVNFVLRISILLILMVFWGIFLCKSYSHNAFSKNGKGGNRLGKAMVNMERACTFDDPINFYEFAKYAIREAMCLPQGKAGLALTLEDVKKSLEQKILPAEIGAVISEIYTTAKQVEKNEDMEIDLKSKLEIYYEVIRRLNNTYEK